MSGPQTGGSYSPPNPYAETFLKNLPSLVIAVAILLVAFVMVQRYGSPPGRVLAPCINGCPLDCPDCPNCNPRPVHPPRRRGDLPPIGERSTMQDDYKMSQPKCPIVKFRHALSDPPFYAMIVERHERTLRLAVFGFSDGRLRNHNAVRHVSDPAPNRMVEFTDGFWEESEFEADIVAAAAVLAKLEEQERRLKEVEKAIQALVG